MFENVNLVLLRYGYGMSSKASERLDLTNNEVIRINLERLHNER